MKALALSITLLLSACVYTETPYGRTAVLDLPVHSQTTVNKTVTINAPPGTTVIYQDSVPVGYRARILTVITVIDFRRPLR